MNTYRFTFYDWITKTYSYRELATEKEAIRDAKEHFARYDKFLSSNLYGIIDKLTEGVLTVESYSMRPSDVKLSFPKKLPRRIPLLSRNRYYSYYKSITVDVMVTMTDDINYLKLKNFKLYNKLFIGLYFDNTFIELRRGALEEITKMITDNFNTLVQNS